MNVRGVRWLIAIILATGGCAQPGPRPVGPDIWPFAPVSLRIHPLSRTEAAGDGGSAVICHLEFVDAWGEPTKAVGALRVELYAAVAPGQTAARTAWDVDLTDLDRNAIYYDRSTRTYRIRLLEAPGDAPASGRLTLRAALLVIGPGGEETVLRDEYTLQR